jgi:DnaJ-class molecular chaperone
MKKALHILGLKKNATKEEVKQAYRNLSKENHPDKNKSANSKDLILKINESYEFIEDQKFNTNYQEVSQSELSESLLNSLVSGDIDSIKDLIGVIGLKPLFFREIDLKPYSIRI